MWDNTAFVAESTSDNADMADHAGPATMNNQGGSGSGTPTRSLLMAWFFFLGLYWGLSYVFRRQLS